MKLIRGKHFSEPPVVRAWCEGSPVYAYGYTHIPAAAPDLLDETVIQKGNHQKQTKIRPQNSDRISSNYIGCASTRMPRISENDELPSECVHLIDGDVQTCWISKTQPRSAMNPVWIRIDLPLQRVCNRIVLRKRPLNPARITENAWGPEDGAVEIGRGIPGYLTVEVSINGCDWEKIFDGETGDDDTKDFFEVAMEERPVRMIRLTGTKLRKVENLMFCFSISNVEVYDHAGRNVALLSRGAGVSVNSTTHSQGQEMEIQRTLLPMHYDLGIKWFRVGYHDDVINWHWVEQKKGELKMDPYADACITEMADNGVETIMCLDYGNRLYTDQGPRIMPQLAEWNYEPPHPPKSEEALAAWKNYCRFMTRHFKDRVHYFEVWNEWNGGSYWGDTPDTQLYIRLAKLAIEAIREEAPEAKIIMGSFAGFVWGCSEWGEAEWEKQKKEHPFLQAVSALGRDVDMIGYHPFYNTDPDSERWRTYDADIRAFDAYCQSEGFHGTYTVSEYNYGNCIPPYEGNMWWGTFSCTELEKAMYIARLIAIHTRYAISSVFCESFSSTHPLDLSLFRRTVTQDPVDAQQPQAAYFVMRNLCTYLDGAEGCEGTLQTSCTGRKVMQTAYTRGEEKLFALWFEGRGKEDFAGEEAQIVFEGEYESLTAFDPVNGVEQKLIICRKDGKTVAEGVYIKDYPVFICAR